VIKSISRPSLVDHVLAQLREGIRTGQWAGKLPGVTKLAAEYEVSHGTLRTALTRLEREGEITPGGNGRNRMVAVQTSVAVKRHLCVTVLLDEKLEDEYTGLQLAMTQLQRNLEGEGHTLRIADKSQRTLKHDLGRIKRYAGSHPSDIWLVVGGSKEVLTWFAEQSVPTIALGGRCIKVPIASVGRDIQEALRAACKHLIAMHHTRIILVGPRNILSPESNLYQIFAGELAAGGVTLSNYYLPKWDETPSGLYALLEETFRFTPPTALIVATSTWLVSVLAFLAQRKLLVPADVSVICMTSDVVPAWRRPLIAHFKSDEDAVVRRIVDWVNAVASGLADRKYIPCHSVFVAGESIGPARLPGSGASGSQDGRRPQ